MKAIDKGVTTRRLEQDAAIKRRHNLVKANVREDAQKASVQDCRRQASEMFSESKRLPALPKAGVRIGLQSAAVRERNSESKGRKFVTKSKLEKNGNGKQACQLSLTRLASARFNREFSPLISSLPLIQFKKAIGRLGSGHGNLQAKHLRLDKVPNCSGG
jgi:hypothetical protein